MAVEGFADAANEMQQRMMCDAPDDSPQPTPTDSPASAADLQLNGDGGDSPTDDFNFEQPPTETDCPYCHRPFRGPRVLKCLHTLCEDCIIAQIEGTAARPQSTAPDELEPLQACNAQLPAPGVVRCPVCKQDSQVGNDVRFVQHLPVDYVTQNAQDLAAVESAAAGCQSCKNKDVAVARCQHCYTFLCANCVQAHQFMTCFEGHRVLTLDELRSAKESGAPIALHRPLYCAVHPHDLQRYYCATCELPICNQCAVTNHKPPEHRPVKVDDNSDSIIRQELRSLIRHATERVDQCRDGQGLMATQLEKLKDKAELAHEHIDTAFAQFRAALDERQAALKAQLDAKQSATEIRIQSVFQDIDNVSERLSDACRFSNRLLDKANMMELLASRKVVVEQMNSLLHSIPSPNIVLTFGYRASEEQFRQAVVGSCGFMQSEVAAEAMGSPSMPPSSAVLGTLSPPNVQFADNNLLIAGVAEAVAAVLQQGRPPPQTLAAAAAADFGGAARVHHNGYGIAPDYQQQQSYANAKPAALQGLSAGVNALRLGRQSHDSNLDSAAFAQTRNSSSAGAFADYQQAKAYPGRLSMGAEPEATLVPYPREFDQFGGLQLAPTTVSGHFSSYGRSADLLAPATPNYLFSSVPQQPRPAKVPSPPYGQSYTPVPNAPARSSSVKSMEVKCRFGALGSESGQFNSPHGFCMGFHDEIVVADTNNHRVQIFNNDGSHVDTFGEAGKADGQLFYPRKVAVVRTPAPLFVVCDRGSERSRMQIFNKDGMFVKKIGIRYIDIVAGLAVDANGDVVAVDSVSPTIFRIGLASGDLLKWFDCSAHMKEPSDIAVSGREYFVCDFKGHAVCVFDDDGKYLRRIGSAELTSFPNGIDVSDGGDVLVGDSHGNRFHVVVFKKDGTLQTEFDCPSVKVARCCGLRISSNGFIVTLAKNNHHVLVLNTLYL